MKNLLNIRPLLEKFSLEMILSIRFLKIVAIVLNITLTSILARILQSPLSTPLSQRIIINSEGKGYITFPRNKTFYKKLLRMWLMLAIKILKKAPRWSCHS